MNRALAPILLGLILLAGCAPKAAELPAPDVLYAAVTESAALPEMIALSADEIAGYYGIEPEAYTAAVAYCNADALEPDEIAVFLAVGEESAEEMVQKLEGWMDYKRRSAANYLPETLTMLERGVVRRDGLTVSLLVCDEIDAVLRIYEDKIS